MFGGVISLLVLVALVAGIFMWVRRSRPGVEVETTQHPRRISLLTEAIAYIGSILVLAGGGVAVGQRWNDMSDLVRLSVLASATGLFLIAGGIVWRSKEPALVRLTSVVWGLATAGFAGTMAFIFTQMNHPSGETAFLVIAGSSSAFATVLWALRRAPLQQLAMFAGAQLTAAAALLRIDPAISKWALTGAVWTIGAVWLTLGWRRRIEPWWVAVPVGLVATLIAPTILGPVTLNGVYAIGIPTGAAVMVFGVAFKFAPALVFGAIGLFGYVTSAVVHYFKDTLGVPLALALTGVLFLGVAGATARLLFFTKKPHPPQEPPEEIGHHERRIAS